MVAPIEMDHGHDGLEKLGVDVVDDGDGKAEKWGAVSFWTSGTERRVDGAGQGL